MRKKGKVYCKFLPMNFRCKVTGGRVWHQILGFGSFLEILNLLCLDDGFEILTVCCLPNPVMRGEASKLPRLFIYKTFQRYYNPMYSEFDTKQTLKRTRPAVDMDRPRNTKNFWYLDHACHTRHRIQCNACKWELRLG